MCDLRWNWIWELSKLFTVKVIGDGWGEGSSNLTGKKFTEACHKARVCLVLPAWGSPNYKGTDPFGTHYSLRNMMYLATGATVVMPDNPDFAKLFSNSYAYHKYLDCIHCIRSISTILKHSKFKNNELVEEIQKLYTYDKQMEVMLDEIKA